MIRRPPRSTLFPYRRSSDLHRRIQRFFDRSRQAMHLVDEQDITLLQRGEDGGEVAGVAQDGPRSEEHTSELQSRSDLVCRLLLEKKKRHRSREDVNELIIAG